MSELPRLVPITRREPPEGYRKPSYGEPNNEEAPGASCYDLMRSSYGEEEDAERLREARRRAGYALYTYRAWGITNIINMIRLFIATWRQKRAQ